MDIREIHLLVQDVGWHAGRAVQPPARRVAACAVLANPMAGQPAGDDFEIFVAASVSVGERLTRRALEALEGRTPIAYGKGALVGERSPSPSPPAGRMRASTAQPNPRSRSSSPGCAPERLRIAPPVSNRSTERTMAKVAFLGLGVMGYPMAGHLLKKGGHEVTVYNRTAAKAQQWAKEYGGRHAPTPREAAKDCDFVLMCVGNDDDVRSVVYGDDGALAGMKKGAILVDHTTASAIVAREVHGKAKEKGVGFVDAPVSGGQAGAQNGQLGVMCGGEDAVFAKAKPLLDIYAKSCALIGGPGAGQLTKMVNQICIAGLLQGLSEGLAFAKRSKLDVEKVISVIAKGAAQSWQMENRWKQMNEVKFDGFGFAVDWMRKDLGICLEEARRNGARLPVAALVDQFYAHIQARGGRRWDTASLMHLLMKD